MTMRQRGGWRMGNDDEKVAMKEGVRVRVKGVITQIGLYDDPSFLLPSSFSLLPSSFLLPSPSFLLPSSFSLPPPSFLPSSYFLVYRW